MFLSLVAALFLQDGDVPARANLDDFMPAFEGTVVGLDEAPAFVLSNDKQFGSPIRYVSLTLSDSMRLRAVSVVFNGVRLDAEGKAAWEARLRAGRGDRVVEMFADSQTCPAIAPSLVLLDTMTDLRVDVPDLPGREYDFGGGSMHDVAFVLRAPAAFPGRRYTQRLELIGGSDAPFAPVVLQVFRALNDCWTAESRFGRGSSLAQEPPETEAAVTTPQAGLL
jgi:hypothetical protein